MGNRLTEEQEKRQASDTPYGDTFDELFPQYLMIGMTPEQYWDGESSLKRAYMKAYRMRVEEQQRMQDTQNWYMGQYIMCVLQAVPLLVGGLNVKPTTRLPEYPEKPFLLKQEADRKEQNRKKKEEDQTRMAMALFQAGIQKMNARILARQKTSDSGQ